MAVGENAGITHVNILPERTAFLFLQCSTDGERTEKR